MSVDAIVHTEFPEGYTILFGADGKVIMTPRSEEHSSTIRSLQIDSALALGRHAKVASTEQALSDGEWALSTSNPSPFQSGPRDLLQIFRPGGRCIFMHRGRGFRTPVVAVGRRPRGGLRPACRR
jgi:hypothetical protein